MNREIDIKALVSHIVKGDGIDKCRICMGDTQDGQVHLGDTVMLDGEKPVTLAELLAIITGVQVEDGPAMPSAVCKDCAKQAVEAVMFQRLCHLSNKEWNQATNSFGLANIEPSEDKCYFLFYAHGTEPNIARHQITVKSKDEALQILNAKIEDDKPLEIKTKRKARKPTKHYSRKLPYKCPDCGKKFHKPYYLNSHLKTTANRACEYCALIVKREKLVEHLRKMHKIHLYCCKICYKLFDYEDKLAEHVQTLHSVDAYMCKICGKGYTHQKGLIAHEYTHTLFHCTSCNVSFGNRTCYHYHKKLCTASSVKDNQTDNIFICDNCDLVYTKKNSIRTHMIQKHIHILPYICSVCGKRSSTLAHLKIHQSIHMKERTVFLCHCGAKLSTAVGFQMHQRIHSGEKPYECTDCGERFLSASRRLDHIKRRHRKTEELPHICRECGAGFVRPSELRKHLQQFCAKPSVDKV